MKAITEWHLGRKQLFAEGGEQLDAEMMPKTVDEITICLKRVKKSVRRWNKEGSRQGYLNSISELIR